MQGPVGAHRPGETVRVRELPHSLRTGRAPLEGAGDRLVTIIHDDLHAALVRRARETLKLTRHGRPGGRGRRPVHRVFLTPLQKVIRGHGDPAGGGFFPRVDLIDPHLDAGRHPAGGDRLRNMKPLPEVVQRVAGVARHPPVRGLECEAFTGRAIRRRFELRADNGDVLSEYTPRKHRGNGHANRGGGGEGRCVRPALHGIPANSRRSST